MSRVGQTFAGHSDAAQLRFLAGCAGHAGHAGRAGRALPPFRRVAGGCVASCGCLEERPQRPQHPPRAHCPKDSPTSAPCSPNSFRLVVVRRRPLQDTPARGISPMEIGRVDCLHYIRHLHDLCRAAPPAGLNRQHAGSMRHRAASSAIVCHRVPSSARLSTSHSATPRASSMPSPLGRQPLQGPSHPLSSQAVMITPTRDLALLSPGAHQRAQPASRLTGGHMTVPACSPPHAAASASRSAFRYLSPKAADGMHHTCTHNGVQPKETAHRVARPAWPAKHPGTPQQTCPKQQAP